MKFSLRRSAGAQPATPSPVSLPPAGSVVRAGRWPRGLHDDGGSCESHVSRADGSTVTLSPSEHQPWANGERLRLSWNEPSGVRIVEGRVAGAEDASFEVRIAGAGALVANQRVHERIAVSSSAMCLVIASRANEGRSVQVQLDDLSEGGVSFRSSLPLAPGDRVRLTPDGEPPREAIVTLVRGASSAWRMRISARWAD